MNIQTVMEIIAMLDERLQVIEKSWEYDDESDVVYDPGQQVGKESALTEFRDYLQGYIHSLQNQVENDMNGGQ